MKIDRAEVQRIAALAQLEFDDDDLARLADQISSILTHMESLARVATEGVEPTFHSLEHAGPFREDVPRPASERGADAAPPCGPSGPFVVPKVISS